MYWTKKHQEWRLRFNLRQSTTELWQWINRKTKGVTTEELEIDLRQFNQWIGRKRYKPYDRKTVKSAIAQLLEQTNGLITEHKKVNWYYYKIVVKPISFLDQRAIPKKEQDPNNLTTESASDGRCKFTTSLQQQHNIDKLNTLLQGVGLKYDRDALNRIWRLSGKCWVNIQQAIELMLYRHRSTPVSKPHGFIMDCLKYNWQEGFDVLYEPELPKFVTNSDLYGFVKGLFSRAELAVP
jgi:hypothetical protein